MVSPAPVIPSSAPGCCEQVIHKPKDDNGGVVWEWVKYRCAKQAAYGYEQGDTGTRSDAALVIRVIAYFKLYPFTTSAGFSPRVS
jgi:hypothetical protein